jgi:hypothetical protein
MWHIWVERASEAKGTKHATDSEKDIQARQTRNDQENMLLPISRKRTFQESMAALESEEDRETEIEGEEQVLDSGNETTMVSRPRPSCPVTRSSPGVLGLCGVPLAM